MDTSKCSAGATGASLCLVIIRRERRTCKSRVSCRFLHRQSLRVKSRDLGTCQVKSVQVVASLFSQGQSLVAIQIEQVNIHSVHCYSLAFLVLENNVKFHHRESFAAACHTQVNLEALAGGNVVLFWGKRMVLVSGIQSLDN